MGAADNSYHPDQRRGDWRAIEALYTQLTELKKAAKKGGESAPAVLPPLADRLAEATAQVFAFYDAAEEDFLDHLRETMLAIDRVDWVEEDRFRNLIRDEKLNGLALFTGPEARPRPFEAAVETVRRIQDLNSIREQLAPLGTSAVLGGSLSFGRFFTVRGRETGRASDIDLVLVLRDYRELTETVIPALEKVADHNGKRFIQPTSLELMSKRARIFRDSYANDPEPTVFQHKLKLWEKGAESAYYSRFKHSLHYKLAVHVVTLQTFHYLTLRDYERLSDIPSRPPVTVRVYRDDPPPKSREDQYCFSGFHTTSQVRCDPVAEGQLCTIQLCAIKKKRFYPGMHLNLMFPQFEVRWESDGARLRLPLQTLRYKLLARLEEERRLHPWELQRLSFAHARSSRFARRVTQRLDGG